MTALAIDSLSGRGIPSSGPAIDPSATTRLLTLDDEASTRQMLARFLAKHRDDVHQCDSGPAALAMLQREHFAVMLCEVHVAEISGLEVVSRALELDGD